MISAVSNSAPAQPVAHSTPISQEKSQPKSATSVPDSVQLSSAAKSALQEATETPAQTAKEAGSGDMQAKRLLQKEEASHAAEK